MRNIRKVLTDRSAAFEDAIKTLGSADFWRNELKTENGMLFDNIDIEC